MNLKNRGILPSGRPFLGLKRAGNSNVNQTAERWLGLSKQEMEGRPLGAFLGPAAWEALRPYAERALAGETVTYEQELPYEPGGPRWVRATYTPDRDETGRVRGFIAHLLDIGERRCVEEELQRSEGKYRNLVYHAPTFIYQVDFRGPRFTTVNDMMCEYIGYTREELLAMNPFDLMDEVQAEHFALVQSIPCPLHGGDGHGDWRSGSR